MQADLLTVFVRMLGGDRDICRLISLPYLLECSEETEIYAG